jgi:phenylacetate-coenzyme A ligase PaaK-like adenylate-forming protein
MLEPLLAAPAFRLPDAEKSRLLAGRLSELVSLHREACPPYARILDTIWDGARGPFERVEDVPWLPVGLFKSHDLRSIPDEAVFKVLRSSGTTGQAPSTIALDHVSAALQTRTLASIMTALLGPERRPMLVVDARSTVRDRRSFNARAAGILGMSTFGRDHLYALDDDMRLQVERVREWLARHEGEPLLVFGFTFMVWKYLVQAAEDEGLDLSRAVLVHSGGWKRLQAEAVSGTQFADSLRAGFGIERVANFYGMVEQIGTVFLECAHGRLHAPNAADVVVRDPETWAPVDDGRPGVIQVLSGLPTSYPGHSILTEDMGAIVSRDSCGCGWLGTAVEIHGRIPRAELRGCSDVHAATVAEAA